MKIINLISKHSKQKVRLFFIWDYEDVHRTNFDMHIKFENECKVSLVFHYVVKSEKCVLLHWGGTVNHLVSYTLYGLSGRDLFTSYGIETKVCIQPEHV